MTSLGAAAAILPPIFHAHPDLQRWIATSVSDTSAALQRDLDDRGHARLLLSGGTTPAPVYRALAKLPLDWARVDVALVDERWLPAGDPDSNANLIENTLLTEHAAAAKFKPLQLPDQDFNEAVQSANRASAAASIAVLGMGADGHIASLFPNMRDLDRALDSTADYVGVDASACPGAGPWPRRISLTPSGLAKTTTRVLLIRGEQKRELVELVLAGSDDTLQLPIRIALSLPGRPLHIHWCP